MKISELVLKLEAVKEAHGDIQVDIALKQERGLVYNEKAVIESKDVMVSAYVSSGILMRCGIQDFPY